MMLYSPIILPIVLGSLCLLIPRKLKGFKEAIALLGAAGTLALTVFVFITRPAAASMLLRLDNLASFILLGVGFFGFLIALYSIKFMADSRRLREYYACLLWSIGVSCGVVLANNLILLLVFWGFLGLTLYLLIGIDGGAKAADAAKKSLVIVGGTDVLMLFGFGVIWYLKGSFCISEISLPLNNVLAILSFVALALCSFAKAGALPLHTWIPDSAESAPAPVMAFLPASIDKLLGIYLLARISLDLFIVEPNSAMSVFLMSLGALTIIAAVMMALVQHNLKKLLAYHAVSQVGYMVLGIGTGIGVAIAGGLFHMLNHAIYKCCLFLCGGSVEHRTKTTDLNKLGGLAGAMPVTFITCVIAAFSISGIPPFNGFISKWMIYQGIIELGKTKGGLWIVWLAAAMFGSGLTLASFMKLIHAVFLGSRSESLSKKSIREVSGFMWLPQAILALLCAGFGVFAYQIPLKLFIIPSIKGGIGAYAGFWAPSLASGLILIGIVLGLIIYALGNIRSLRTSQPYVGGEVYQPGMRVSGVEFYNTIRELSPLKEIYKKAESKLFDIYDQGKRIVFFVTRVLRYLHNGVLPTYLVWALLGMTVLFFVLVK